VEHNLRKDIAEIFSMPQESLFASTEDSGMSLREWQDRIRGADPSLRLRAALRQALSEEATLRGELLEVFREIWPQEFEIVQFRLPRGMMAVEEYLDFYFTNSVRYLGPLRDEPKALYPLGTPSDPMDVGVRGEFTAAVLDLYKSRPVRYIPASKFSGAQIAPTPTVRTLETAVTDWMNYLGVAETFRSKDRGKLGHELQVSLTPKGRYQDLTHVGVGVSQVLPILVGCLLAAKDSVVILEQPEIHLHPKVQTLLGDFFLAMALLGKQCIIETHSEYLINRLRLRAASAPLTRSLTAYMKIYFVEKTEGQSVFKEIEVNEFGAVTDWPEGFLDQSQREAEETLRAALRKKQELRTKEREKLGWPSE
jgi:predicted ATPase